ncbi:MAG: hypothetical protein H6589_08735 [Flavobacteriales bacterium]|nr:hypothetical protein [Flavobacteriales bacterium]
MGKNFLIDRQLLVIGQATNGWKPKWFVKDIPAQTDKIVTDSIDYSSEEKGICPLEWINEKWSAYSLFRSFFWNVTYKLVKEKYNRSDKDWNNIIAWSNLMKIAPSDYGNPNSEERQAQMEGCAKLFIQELEDLKPKNVLIITNLDTWAEPILRLANIQIQEKKGNYIQAIGQHENTKIIVTRRPFIGRHRPFVEELSKELN